MMTDLAAFAAIIVSAIAASWYYVAGRERDRAAEREQQLHDELGNAVAVSANQQLQIIALVGERAELRSELNAIRRHLSSGTTPRAHLRLVGADQ